MNLEVPMSQWVRWKDRLDELEVKKDCGHRPFGIEYRFMLENKTVLLDPKKPWIHRQLVEDVDLCWRKLHAYYPKEMEAIEIFYKRRKSFRAVRVEMDCSQHMSKRLVQQGELLMVGALLTV